MAIARDYSESQIQFEITGGAADQFEVVRFRGTEGLCQLYRFEIEMAASGEAIVFDDVVGQTARLTVNGARGTRWFSGVISRFELTNDTHDMRYFRAELVPALWLLTHRYRSRIFQDMSVPDIISQVLTDAGIPSDSFRLELEGTYDPRVYCVQYRESEYNFISRLMEAEGIWWYFEQSEEGHVLVIADASSAYKPIEGEATLAYQPPSSMVVSEDHVFRFRMAQGVRPGAVVLNDFNFENPQLHLETSSDCGRDTDLSHADYPGAFTQQAAGQTLAGIRAEEFEAGRRTSIGQSNCERLAPGLTFTLEEHPVEAVNQDYLVTSVTHQGKQAITRSSTNGAGRGSILSPNLRQALRAADKESNQLLRDLAHAVLQVSDRIKGEDQTANREIPRWLYHAGQVSQGLALAAIAAGRNPLEACTVPNLLDDVAAHGLVEYEAPVYECRFECIPSEVPYRPARATPWPVMRGTQTARVVGPSGDEIYTDKYGRVKVQFNWDREGEFTETSSCWIRVTQGFAGGHYGIFFLPRVGQEVVIDFLEGDPDKPMIVGSVYNADQMPPYELPKEKTKSTIKTNSSVGGGGFNELRFEDSKDKEQIFIHGQKDLDVRIRNDEKDFIGNDKHEIIKRDQFKKIERDEHRIVKQDLMLHVKRDHHIKVDGKGATGIGGSFSLTVGGDVAESFGGKHSMEVADKSTIKASEVVITASSGVTLVCGGSFVKVDPGGVSIVGPVVNINSGGSAGSPTIVKAVAPVAAEEPKEAATGDPGEDFVYEKSAAETEALDWHDDSEASDDPEKTWIGIRLWDDNGTPLAGERYEVILSDGTTVARGTLNQEGEAYIRGIDPGDCQINFVDLDAATWQAGLPPGGIAADSDTESSADSTAAGSETSSDSAT